MISGNVMQKVSKTIFVLLALAAFLLAGCVQQPQNDATNGNGTTGGENAREITVEGFEYGYSPSTINLSQGETVRIIFKNVGTMPHNFVADEFNAATPAILPGEQITAELTASQAGNFAFYCSVGNHRQLGMEGTITVE